MLFLRFNPLVLCILSLFYHQSIAQRTVNVDDSSTEITYISPSGSWTSVVNPDLTFRNFWNATETYSDVQGATAVFRFTGAAIQLWSGSAPDHGQCRINIDGVDQGLVNSNSPTYGPSVILFRFLGLNPNLPHTITVTVQDATFPNICAIDRFIYLIPPPGLPPPPPPPFPPPPPPTFTIIPNPASTVSSTVADPPNNAPIIGGAIGGALGFIIAFLVGFFVLRRYRRRGRSRTHELPFDSDARIYEDPVTFAPNESLHYLSARPITLTSLNSGSPSQMEERLPSSPTNIGFSRLKRNEAEVLRLAYEGRHGQPESSSGGYGVQGSAVDGSTDTRPGTGRRSSSPPPDYAPSPVTRLALAPASASGLSAAASSPMPSPTSARAPSRAPSRSHSHSPSPISAPATSPIPATSAPTTSPLPAPASSDSSPIQEPSPSSPPALVESER